MVKACSKVVKTEQSHMKTFRANRSAFNDNSLSFMTKHVAFLVNFQQNYNDFLFTFKNFTDKYVAL